MSRRSVARPPSHSSRLPLPLLLLWRLLLPPRRTTRRPVCQRQQLLAARSCTCSHRRPCLARSSSTMPRRCRETPLLHRRCRSRSSSNALPHSLSRLRSMAALRLLLLLAWQASRTTCRHRSACRRERSRRTLHSTLAHPHRVGVSCHLLRSTSRPASASVSSPRRCRCRHSSCHRHRTRSR